MAAQAGNDDAAAGRSRAAHVSLAKPNGPGRAEATRESRSPGQLDISPFGVSHHFDHVGPSVGQRALDGSVDRSEFFRPQFADAADPGIESRVFRSSIER